MGRSGRLATLVCVFCFVCVVYLSRSLARELELSRHAHTNTLKHIHAYTHLRARVQTRTHARAHTHTHKHTHTHTHTHMHACMHAYTHAYLYIRIHMNRWKGTRSALQFARWGSSWDGRTHFRRRPMQPLCALYLQLRGCGYLRWHGTPCASEGLGFRV